MWYIQVECDDRVFEVDHLVSAIPSHGGCL